ncbi:MAG TPA: type I glyceraldehyde-3-phosphate dehydrogenase [Flavobacteriaceae bacterium]|nr:type I glyceraldehyde-3-phosphate dehydrogenase [Flavobacteriaceae bacterium]
MIMIKLGINGFGRIGRLAFREAIKRNIDVVAINDLLDVEYLAYLLKYDSVHGRFDGDVSVKDGMLIVNGMDVRITAERNPKDINWGAVGAEYIIEATGFFLIRETADLHIQAGAKKVILSAPPKDDIPMYVMGVNHKDLSKDTAIFSNASCTTNCLAPIAKVLNDNFGIDEALMSTIHAATSGQKPVDAPSGNWRRGRSVFGNIIPTTTGAAKAVGKVIPSLKGKITGMAMRIPAANVSIVDLTVKLNKATSYEEIKQKMKEAADGDLKGILAYTDDEVVSTDFIGETHTSVFDAGAGIELNDKFFKVISWYDNEYGYATKIVELLVHAASL